MQTGFDSVKVLTEWQGEDLPDLLPSGFEFWWRGRKYRHRPGGYTDGMSSPQFLHLTKSTSARGWAFPPAVAHDGGYHNGIELLNKDGVWVHINLMKEDCDAIFKELMESIADTTQKQVELLAFYEAVHLCGQAAYDLGHQSMNK